MEEFEEDSRLDTLAYDKVQKNDNFVLQPSIILNNWSTNSVNKEKYIEKENFGQ